jgi:hypothetical protein
MINIIDVDYIDECSCCGFRTKITIELSSVLSSIDFCEKCWLMFKDKFNEYNKKEPF